MTRLPYLVTSAISPVAVTANNAAAQSTESLDQSRDDASIQLMNELFKVQLDGNLTASLLDAILAEVDLRPSTAEITGEYDGPGGTFTLKGGGADKVFTV